jgi:hypothetical protein
MTIDTVRSALLWSGIINYGILILWVLIVIIVRSPMHRVARWYGVSAENFDLIQFGGITLYKTAIIMFFLVPYVALRIVG